MQPTPATSLLITTVVDLVTRATNGAHRDVSALVRERLAGSAEGRAALAGLAGKQAHPAAADALRTVLQREIAADAAFTAALARAVIGEPALGPPPARPHPRLPGRW
ncbi:hypothetical protein [Streptomyces sp. B6B3]|uniref:hypothetical protein n=1 Tax=Streptomyces sp. B6B3 TaxID=3153570 RepID=UPI00325EDFA3